MEKCFYDMLNFVRYLYTLHVKFNCFVLQLWYHQSFYHIFWNTVFPSYRRPSLLQWKCILILGLASLGIQFSSIFYYLVYLKYSLIREGLLYVGPIFMFPLFRLIKCKLILVVFSFFLFCFFCFFIISRKKIKRIRDFFNFWKTSILL